MPFVPEKSERIEKIGSFDFIQSKTGLRVSSDPFLLSDFILPLKKTDRVIDLGTGSGVIPLYLCSRSEVEKIVGVEKDKGMALAAQRNVRGNDLSRRVEIIERDWRDLPEVFRSASFTHVVSNPPYIKRGTGRVSPGRERALARYETAGVMKDMVDVSKYLIGRGGKIFYIYPVTRFVELTAELAGHGLKPVRICFVYTGRSKKAKLFIMEAGVRKGTLVVESPVFI